MSVSPVAAAATPAVGPFHHLLPTPIPPLPIPVPTTLLLRLHLTDRRPTSRGPFETRQQRSSLRLVCSHSLRLLPSICVDVMTPDRRIT